MTEPRNYGAELDSIKSQIDELQRLVQHVAGGIAPASATARFNREYAGMTGEPAAEGDLGKIYYSGHYLGEKRYRWEPQERSVGSLLSLDGDKAAKVLAALGSKQRLDILRAVLKEPLSGTELVERLNMGTTGQLYHHTKALLGADLLVQEERGGLYSLPPHRSLPLLLLLAAASDLLDTSDYMDLSEARGNAGDYLGESQEAYDPHYLLWAMVENSILEHRAGYCTEISLILQPDGSMTVADNGRGIPVQALADSGKTPVHAVLTELGQFGAGASIVAPGGEKGINMAVVNALSERLLVEVRREGKVFRQDYKRGIPQTGLLTIGTTKETGTSVTIMPDRDIFKAGFDPAVLAERVAEVAGLYPGLSIRFNR